MKAMVFPGQLDLSHTQKEEGERLPASVLGGGGPSFGSPGYIINIRKNSNLGTLTYEMTVRRQSLGRLGGSVP